MTEGKRRSFRIFFLLFAIFVFHVGDLFMTLSALDSEVMIENNYVAKTVVHGGSVSAIILYKISLLFIGFVILWLFRHRIYIETICWAMVVILTMLTFKWINYIDVIQKTNSDFGHYIESNN